jgi:ribosomal protein S4E
MAKKYEAIYGEQEEPPEFDVIDIDETDEHFRVANRIIGLHDQIRTEAVKEFANMILSPFRNQKYLSKRDLEIIVENLAKYC